LDEHSGSYLKITSADFSSITDFNEDNLSQIVLPLSGATSGPVGTQVRRLTQVDKNDSDKIICFYVNATTLAAGTTGAHDHDAGSYELRDVIDSGNLGVVQGVGTDYTLENNANIPEIFLKSISRLILQLSQLQPRS
jgi:hypothetical protein